MQTLRSFQQHFKNALFSRSEISEALGQKIHPGKLSVERRIQVYRNNLFVSLIESLRATYPVIAELVGNEFFAMLGHRYIEQHPSRSGDLHQFGSHYSEFIRTQNEAAPLPYLSDLAQLEWAYHTVFHAEEKPAITPTDLASLAQDEFADVRFELHPASFLMSSNYPLTSIWNLAAHDKDGGTVNLDDGPEHILIARRQLEMEFQTMSRADYAFLKGFEVGQTLEKCAESALEINPKFDVTTCLSQQFSRQNITGFSVGIDSVDTPDCD